MEEEWRPVKGYEGMYSVSNMGRVRSEDREINGRWGPRTIYGVILKPAVVNGNYCVALSKGGVKRTRPVGVLVAEVFLEGYDSSANVLHINGNALDNRIFNLRQVSPLAKENAKVAPWDSRPQCKRGHAKEEGAACTACQYWSKFIRSGYRFNIPAEALEELYATYNPSAEQGA